MWLTRPKWRKARRLFAAHERIDILINNAGIETSCFPDISSEKEMDRMINIHLKGSFNCCQAVLASMIANNMERLSNKFRPGSAATSAAMPTIPRLKLESSV